jgi:hypothetical protein
LAQADRVAFFTSLKSILFPLNIFLALVLFVAGFFQQNSSHTQPAER